MLATRVTCIQITLNFGVISTSTLLFCKLRMEQIHHYQPLFSKNPFIKVILVHFSWKHCTNVKNEFRRHTCSCRCAPFLNTQPILYEMIQNQSRALSVLIEITELLILFIYRSADYYNFCWDIIFDEINKEALFIGI